MPYLVLVLICLVFLTNRRIFFDSIDLSNNVDSGYWDFGNDSITNYVYGETPRQALQSLDTIL